jgi:hypothetical protein
MTDLQNHKMLWNGVFRSKMSTKNGRNYKREMNGYRIEEAHCESGTSDLCTSVLNFCKHNFVLILSYIRELVKPDHIEPLKKSLFVSKCNIRQLLMTFTTF